MPRNSNDDQRGSQSRERDDDGRFTSSGSSSQSRYDNDDDDYRTSGRGRDDEGRFTSGRGRSQEDRDFEDWHAYGHDRGWHAHQQGRHGQANRNRDEEGRFTRSGRGAQGRDDDRSYGASSGLGGSSQGRGWHGDPEGHARAGSMSHSGSASQSHGRDYDDDDDARGRSSGNRERDENGRFTGNRH